MLSIQYQFQSYNKFMHKETKKKLLFMLYLFIKEGRYTYIRNEHFAMICIAIMIIINIAINIAI